MRKIDIKLKKAILEDIPSILEVDESVTGTKLYHGFAGSDDRQKDFVENIFYLIEKDKKDIGYVAYSDIEKDKIYIRWLAVKKDFQGQGIAKKAMQILINQLKNIETVELVTHPENKKAIALYKSLGFKQIGTQIENYFGDGEPKIKMILEK